ncbi:hypothetical protein THIOM_000645 [Candidatus Thiomargarita nelsonii]|uniref:Uncharacterized protein n=1 Tax=Candidatus Thiomargarita nelsonii TaxID=1003181 RepID=A0A176S6H3_9GAMM|nr:hypothetical protein THIOM_000645 [Candidatus Thiomargarita nelsonii]
MIKFLIHFESRQSLVVALLHQTEVTLKRRMCPAHISSQDTVLKANRDTRVGNKKHVAHPTEMLINLLNLCAY